MLFSDYGIASLADLEAAIGSGALAKAFRAWEPRRSRTGSAASSHIRAGSGARRCRRRSRSRTRRSPSFVREGPPVDRLVSAGSLRRQEVTVGDIDIVCTSHDAAGVIAHFTAWERAEAVLAEGPTKASIWLPGGLQIDLRVLPDHLYGNLLQHFTGSREHNIKLREHAVRQRPARERERHPEPRDRRRDRRARKKTASTRRSGCSTFRPNCAAGSTRSISRSPARFRSWSSRPICAATFTCTPTWSDGDDSLEAMIAAAAARGYEYHAISDHSQRTRPALSACTRRTLREQRAEIEALGERYGIRTLCASEVDILPDGSLDFDDGVLAELDVVVASVHSAMQPIARGDDGAADSRVRKSVRYDHRPSDRAPLRRRRRLRVRLRCGVRGRRAHRHGARDRRPGDAAGSSRAAGAQGQVVRRDVRARQRRAPHARSGRRPSSRSDRRGARVSPRTTSSTRSRSKTMRAFVARKREGRVIRRARHRSRRRDPGARRRHGRPDLRARRRLDRGDLGCTTGAVRRRVLLRGDRAARQRRAKARSRSGEITREGFADDVLAVADACGAERFTLVGCSLGGVVAFELWRRVPRRIRRGWCCWEVSRAIPTAKRNARQITAAVREAGDMRAFGRMSRGKTRHAAGAAARDGRADGVQVGRVLSRFDAGNVDRRLSRRSAADRRAGTGRVRRARRVAPRATRRKRSRTEFRRARLAIVEDAGHVANADNPPGVQRAAARVS